MNTITKLGLTAILYLTTITGCATDKYEINGSKVEYMPNNIAHNNSVIIENQKDGDIIKLQYNSKSNKLGSFEANGITPNETAADYDSLFKLYQNRLEYILNSVDSIDRARNKSLFKAIED